VKSNGYLVAVCTAVALIASACGGAGDGADAGGDGADDTVQTTEYQFQPSSLSIPADTPVTIEVDNSRGVIEHDFTIDEADVHIHADPGKTTRGVVSVPAGTYTFYCSVPGHREQGMEGELTAG